MSSSIRQIHRWLSIIFTAGVITNLIVYTLAGKGHQPAFWWNLLVVIPAFLLMVSGLYMFALPYAAKWSRAGRANALAGQS